MPALKTSITNILAAGAMALATITSGAAPAAADEKDLLRAIVGIGAVAVIAGAINQNRSHTYAVPQAHVPYRQQPLALQDYAFQQHEQGFYPRDRRFQDDRRGPRLPGACALEVGHGRNVDVYYSEDCLRRAGVGYGLPRYCAERVRSRGFEGRVYEAECLREAGFRTGGRH